MIREMREELGVTVAMLGVPCRMQNIDTMGPVRA
jgi:hypothetical protein